MSNIVQRAKLAWNASADKYNQWGVLSKEEIELLIIKQEASELGEDDW